MPSLTIRLGVNRTTFLLMAPSERQDALAALARGLPNARLTSGVLEVELDELLSNLRLLAAWPSPTDVVWDDPARTVAEDSVRDSAAARASLADGVQPLGEVEVLSLLGPRWRGTLTSFQLRDIGKILSLRHAANFSVPGSGKTRVGLAVYSADANQGKVNRLLVVSPKSAFESWESENDEVFGPERMTMAVFRGEADHSTECLLVNYERLPQARGKLATWLEMGLGMVILDEAHRMKLGVAGAYGSVCMALGPLARRRLILTGTPAPNGVDDLKSLMGFVWPGQGRRVVSQAVAGGNLRAASAALKPFFARTTKSELNLPPVHTRTRRLRLPPLHDEIYRSLLGVMSPRAKEGDRSIEKLGRVVMYLLMAADTPALLATGTTRYDPLSYRVPPLDVPADAPLAALMRDLPSYEMSPKYQEALTIVADNASHGRKTLVWSTFVRSIMTLEVMLEPFSPAVVHGGTEDRSSQLDRFREDPSCKVLLSNPATLGEGISLHQICHDAVFVDRDFAAGRYVQSLDRIHRLGLDPGEVTRITVLMSENTIDEIVHGRLTDKVLFMSQILDDPDLEVLGDLEDEPAVGAGLDTSDLQALLGHLS